MKLQQLETFFWTVTLGSFSAAAERLHATQSTVSMRIRELERSLGVELFDRSQRSARLTPKGRELMDYAGRLLDLTAEIEHRVAAPESVTGSVRLGVAEVVSLTWLPRLIELIFDIYPRVHLEIDEGLTAELMDGLASGALDLTFAPGHESAMGVSARSLGTVDFAWMASPSLALKDQPLGPAELSGLPLIGLRRGSYHHASIEDWFARAQSRCRYLARCKSMTVAASMTTAGLGISYLPLCCFQEAIDQGRLKVLDTSPPLPPVEFVAASSVDEFHPLASRVAELAAEVSDFEKIP